MNTHMTMYSRKPNWNPIQELTQEMDRLLETAHGWQPSCEVTEEQDHYLLSLEMAGVPKDQIKIEVIENQLVVSGERKYNERKKENGFSYTERKYGKFQRSFNLPVGLDSEKIEADCQDGILRILVPKSETAKPRQIKIGSGTSSGFFSKLIGQPSVPKDKQTELAS